MRLLRDTRAFARALAAATAVVGISADRVTAQSTLPVLRRIQIPGLDSIGPERANAAIAISSTAIIAFTGSFDNHDRAVTVIDTAGRVLARIGPPGQGPGELTMPVHLTFTRTEVIAVELSARRVSRFGLDGALHGTTTMPAPMFLVGSNGDSLDVLRFPGAASNPVLDFARVSPVSLEGRLLLSGQSSFLRALGEEGRQQGAAVASIVYIADGPTVVAANVGSYRLVGVEGDGRVAFDVRGPRVDTPPGETPLYAIGGLQRDAMQRIWALGTDHATGRTFADLYLKGRYLGRLDLPCRGTVSVSGAYLAILCATPDAADSDVSLSVYRINS